MSRPSGLRVAESFSSAVKVSFCVQACASDSGLQWSCLSVAPVSLHSSTVNNPHWYTHSAQIGCSGAAAAGQNNENSPWTEWQLFRSKTTIPNAVTLSSHVMWDSFYTSSTNLIEVQNGGKKACYGEQSWVSTYSSITKTSSTKLSVNVSQEQVRVRVRVKGENWRWPQLFQHDNVLYILPRYRSILQWGSGSLLEERKYRAEYLALSEWAPRLSLATVS